MSGNTTKVADNKQPSTTQNSGAGKGDRPRHISKKYWDNYSKIKGFKAGKYR